MLNGPMTRPEGAPKDWICNAKTEHGKTHYRYNSRGRVKELKDPCMCVACLRQQCLGLKEGPPVQCHPDTENWSAEVLEEKGYVGIYEGGGRRSR